MVEIHEIIERIKDIIAHDIGDRKVLDKDVAIALGITPEHLAILKLRRRIPVDEVARFCAARHICINWLLFDQHPRSLCENTEKFIYAALPA